MTDSNPTIVDRFISHESEALNDRWRAHCDWRSGRGLKLQYKREDWKYRLRA